MFRTQHNKSCILTLTLVCLLGWTPEVHAYFDPGTGSMVLQLLMASILGFLFTLKTSICFACSADVRAPVSTFALIAGILRDGRLIHSSQPISKSFVMLEKGGF